MEAGVTKTLVARPDGKSLIFYKGGDSGWVAGDGVFARLSLVTYPVGPSEYRLDDGFGGVEFYNMAGRLQRLTTPGGDEQRLFYGADGRLARVVDRQGRELAFEYLDGRLQRLLQPDGNVITFAYTANGDLSEVQYPDGARTEYRYDEAGYSAAPTNSGLMTAVIHDGQRYSSTKYDSRRMAINLNGHRDYDGDAGRYLQSDPMGLRAGISTYAYANSAPLRLIDPNGLQGVPPVGGAASAAAATGSGGAAAGMPRGDGLGPVDPFGGPRLNLETLQNLLRINEAVSLNPNSPLMRLVRHQAMSACDEDEAEACYKQIADCEKHCAEVRNDFRRQGVWGGNWARCMLGCVSWRCMGYL